MRGRRHVRTDRLGRHALARRRADERSQVHDEVGLKLAHILGDHVLAGRQIAVPALQTENLVRIFPSPKLLDERAPDEAGSACDQDLHRRRVYWAALAATCLALAGCSGHAASASHPATTGTGPFFALDREHQRLVADYQPVSRKLFDFETAYRQRQAGAIAANELRTAALDLRKVVRTARRRVAGDRATGPTARAKRLLLGALDARGQALDALVRANSGVYRRDWDRSVVLAREGLTKLQDIRDRARLIPLPEDRVS